jgi:hypothetical protein
MRSLKTRSDLNQELKKQKLILGKKKASSLLKVMMLKYKILRYLKIKLLFPYLNKIQQPQLHCQLHHLKQ